ncbi:UNVERIFIED_CONTAM: hypothetical protein K2H54_015856 [Gekko kuhli]
MPSELLAETAQLVTDYLQYHLAAFPKPCKVAAHLSRVAAQLEADGGLNWGRVVALFVFITKLAAVLAEWGTHKEIDALAEALVTYLAREKHVWLEVQGGWEGFYRFFNKHDSDVTDYHRTIRNGIIAAVGFGLAGLAFLSAVR